MMIRVDDAYNNRPTPALGAAEPATEPLIQ
jgi:hypothetical protein